MISVRKDDRFQIPGNARDIARNRGSSQSLPYHVSTRDSIPQSPYYLQDLQGQHGGNLGTSSHFGASLTCQDRLWCPRASLLPPGRLALRPPQSLSETVALRTGLHVQECSFPLHGAASSPLQHMCSSIASSHYTSSLSLSYYLGIPASNVAPASLLRDKTLQRYLSKPLFQPEHRTALPPADVPLSSPSNSDQGGSRH